MIETKFNVCDALCRARELTEEKSRLLGRPTLSWERLARIEKELVNLVPMLIYGLTQVQRAATPGPDPEPTFVIKAKDLLAEAAISEYQRLCVSAGLVDQAKQVELAALEMVAWRRRHWAEVQLPDHRHVPAGVRTVTAQRDLAEGQLVAWGDDVCPWAGCKHEHGQTP